MYRLLSYGIDEESEQTSRNQRSSVRSMQSQHNTTKHIISEKNVLWLDVTMNYAHIMTIIDRGCNLTDIGRCSSFTESLALIQVLIHISTWTILQNHIHTLLVPKVAVHTQNVLVFQTGLDFNFTFNLLLDSTRIHQFLFNGFDGYNELGFNLTSEVHTTY